MKRIFGGQLIGMKSGTRRLFRWGQMLWLEVVRRTRIGTL